MSTFVTSPRLNLYYGEGTQTRKLKEQLWGIHHGAKVVKTPAGQHVKRLKEESFGGIPQSLTAHIKHQQDLNIKKTTKKAKLTSNVCSMGTAHNKARDFTFLSYRHDQVT